MQEATTSSLEALKAYSQGDELLVSERENAATARAAYLGKLKSARELSTQALQIARENNFKDSGAGVAAFEALLEAEVGNFGQARERAATSLALSRKRTNLPAIAVALALTGDSKQAQGIVDELKRRYPVDTVANSVFIPCAQALLESNRGDSARGIQALQPAIRYELGPVYFFLPIYVRGLVYLHSCSFAGGRGASLRSHRRLGQEQERLSGLLRALEGCRL